MKYILLLVGIIMLPIPAAGATEADSPSAYFATQEAENAERNAAIARAKTLADLDAIGVLPDTVKPYVDQIPKDQQARYVAAVVEDLDTHTTTLERIDGNRAVVLREPQVPGAPNRIVEMSKENGSWKPVNETRTGGFDERGWLGGVISAARGGFTVSGAVVMDLPDALLEFNGNSNNDDTDVMYPELAISDVLGKSLNGKENPAVLFINPPLCPTLGTQPLAPKIGSFRSEAEKFSETETFLATEGTMNVTSIDGGRFTGKFSLKMASEDDPSRTVTVEGEVKNSPVWCFE